MNLFIILEVLFVIVPLLMSVAFLTLAERKAMGSIFFDFNLRYNFYYLNLYPDFAPCAAGQGGEYSSQWIVHGP
jgi:hypothetical protein